MKNLRTVISLLCLMGTGYAAASPVPTLVNVRFTSTYIPGMLAWSFDATADVVLVENSTIGDSPARPGYRYGFAMNYYCKNFGHYVCTSGNRPHSMYPYFVAKPGETVSQVLMRVYKKSGGKFIGGYYRPDSANVTEGCIGSMYSNSSPSSNPGNTTEFYNHATPVGGLTCIVPPEPNEFCDIKTTNIDIEHGNISPSGNSTRRKAFDVHCTAKLDVRLTFDKKNLTLAPGLTSTLSVPEAAANGDISLKAGDNTLNIESELTAVNAVAGEHQASTVLFLTYQ